ncbi:MAG: hypothetical protein C4K49_07810 [Candidatus Thorarchaeota archaeon]|nr:MAG: hypothetical protein C4K49_07810 [Candidatus Thorarchaeota archaeon]
MDKGAAEYVTKKHVDMVKQIGGCIEQVAGPEAARKVISGSEKLSKATPEETALWMKGAIDRLDKTVDKTKRTQIMELCGRNCAQVNKGLVERYRKKRVKFESLDNFIVAEEKNPQKGTRIERAGNVVYHYYTPESYGQGLRCFCALFRGLPKKERASLTYCNCSKAFVETVWQAIVGKPVKVDLIESSISGAKECKFAVHL